MAGPWDDIKDGNSLQGEGWGAKLTLVSDKLPNRETNFINTCNVPTTDPPQNFQPMWHLTWSPCPEPSECCNRAVLERGDNAGHSHLYAAVLVHTPTHTTTWHHTEIVHISGHYCSNVCWPKKTNKSLYTILLQQFEKLERLFSTCIDYVEKFV